MGRYAFYGIFSCCLLFRKGFSPLKIYTPRICMVALLLAFVANTIYYVALIIGLRFASPSITVLVVGLSPILIVFYGNLKVREISYKQMIFPCIWIAVGMVLVNFADVDWSFTSYSVWEYMIGLAGMLVALVCWTLYVVHNARFLKKNPQIPQNQWATAIGVATFIWLCISTPLLGMNPNIMDLKQFLTPTKEVITFYICGAILGIVCSWLGCFLWNKASKYLPVSLIGPLMIFETLFGILYIYIFELRFPSLLEAFGIISMLGGTGLAIYSFRNTEFTHS